MSEPICVVQPWTWPEDLQEWGKKVAKTEVGTFWWTDPNMKVPEGYFSVDKDNYFLQKAVKACRNYEPWTKEPQKRD